MSIEKSKVKVQEQHVTTDIGEASYLVCLGFKVKRFDRSNKDRVAIVIAGDEALLKMKAIDYYEYRTSVDARTYSDTIKHLKKAILEGKPRWKV